MPRQQADPDWTEAVTIPLKGGNNIHMRREDDGELLLCNDTACLKIPATAPEFLALVQFFQSLNDEDDDGRR